MADERKPSNGDAPDTSVDTSVEEAIREATSIEQARDREQASPGALLRGARLAKKLETKEVAATLNVDPWMLDALEHDEYAALGAPVFAKGHLRKYAAALGLDDSDVLVAYYQREGAREAPPLVAESILRVEAARGRGLGWVAPSLGVLALSVIALALFLYFQPNDSAESARAATPQPETVVSVSGAERSQQLRLPSAAAPSESAATPPPVQAPSSNTAASTTAITPQPLVTSKPVSVARVDTPAPQPVTAPERAAPEPQPDQAPAQAAPSRASQVRVTLNFDGDSWVEIYDSERRKLLYDMGRAGSRRTVTGDGPLQVFLGKASDVDVRVNGQPYTVERITSRGTARFYVDRTGR